MKTPRIIALALLGTLGTTAAMAQVPCNTVENCDSTAYCAPAQYCATDYGCNWDNADQQPLLNCYTTLANKYNEYGEAGRRAELAKGNQEVQTLYNLKNHFKQHSTPKLTTEQQAQLWATEGCMGE